MNCAIIFGGTGFLGTFYASTILKSNKYSKIYLIDIDPLNNKNISYRKKLLINEQKILFKNLDVRDPISWKPEEKVDLIANFSAIHREPGHEPYEYFETNILGGENVCKFAELVNCNNILFSSSISPYGDIETTVSEKSIPCPTTPYGSSKLVAEKIHEKWQAKSSDHRLIIIRPGVIYGPGEGGNVSRLIKAVKNNYFVYIGNKNVRKAGIYVKELCYAIEWLRENKSSEKVIIANMSYMPSPSFNEYVEAIRCILNKRFPIPSISPSIVMALTSIISFFLNLIKVNHPFHKVRVNKLLKSNNVQAQYLNDNGYKYKYTLKSSLEDWRSDFPDEW